jgi:mannosyltransferase OCH1-like enzyme
MKTKRIHQRIPQRIPRIIHQIWLGDNRPKEWMNSFKLIYSDYEYKVWDETNIPALWNQDLFEREEKGCAKADILRYEILYRYGGVYFDSDMIALKKIPDEFLDNEFWSAYENEVYVPGLVNNAVIGCVPKHPVIKEILQGLQFRDASLPTWKRFGPGYLTEVLERYEGQKNVYESKYFHPIHFIDRKKGTENNDRLKNAYVDHKFSSTKI